MLPELLGTIDNQLGDHRSRYFGSGFTQVQHDVLFVGADSEQSHFMVSATYPSEWSTKAGVARTAHLSSVDALVIAINMLELALGREYCDGAIRHAWLKRCELLPPRISVDVATSFPAGFTMSVSEGRSEGLFIDAAVDLKGFRVKLVVVMPEHECGNPYLPSCSYGYYSGGYKEVGRRLGEVRWVAEESAELSYDIHSPGSVKFSGLESEYSHAPSFLDATLIAAQAGQVMLYEIDKLDREHTKNMWLRNAVISRNSWPESDPERGVARLKVLRTQKVSRTDIAWRTLDLMAVVSGVQIKCSLAHRLPPHTAVSLG